MLEPNGVPIQTCVRRFSIRTLKEAARLVGLR